jgi:hypothetical protein
MVSILSTPKAGRQSLLNAFIDLCESQKAAPNDVASAALYLACIASFDRLGLTKELFLDMCKAFWESTVSQRTESDAQERLRQVLDRVRH